MVRESNPMRLTSSALLCSLQSLRSWCALTSYSEQNPYRSTTVLAELLTSIGENSDDDRIVIVSQFTR